MQELATKIIETTYNDIAPYNYVCNVVRDSSSHKHQLYPGSSPGIPKLLNEWYTI